MLVLLVIFMATAPLFNLHEVRPPKVDEESTSPAAGDGFQVVYHLNESFSVVNLTTEEKILLFDEDSVVDRVKTACFLNSERPVQLWADKELPYGKVMKLYGRIDAETDCARRVGLGVQPEDE